MTFSIRNQVAAFASKLQSTGIFDAVATHEPKAAPPGNMTAAVWIQRLFPTSNYTSLNSTSIVVVFNVRVYLNMLMEPQDEIDTALMEAIDTLLDLISGDFSLTDAVDHVDLLGETGQGMEVDFGYVELAGAMYRVADVTVPVVAIDVYDQTR